MTASLIAASVDQTRGNIFLTPLIELATLNSHTVTQNCTASWTTKRNKKQTKEKNSWRFCKIKKLYRNLQDYIGLLCNGYSRLPEVVFQYSMVLITEIALSTCKAKVSVSFRYCTNISCFFSSPSSPSFSGSFCGVGGKFWLSSEVSSSEPEENVKYCTLKIKWAFNQPSLKRCLTAAQLFMKLYEIKNKKQKTFQIKT